MRGRLLMLDLFCGLQGASQAMRERGWHVHAVDIQGHFVPRPDELADLREWSWHGPRPDLVWASPPCVEFSRESMPWCRTGKAPSLDLVQAAVRIVEECQPRFWVIENVRGATPYLGSPAMKHGPWHLWGRFPTFTCDVPYFKERLSSSQREERAKLPRSLSLALALAVECSLIGESDSPNAECA